MIRSGRHIVIPAIMQVTTRAPASAAIIPWYLAGGVSAANCIAAYQPKGAASLAASYTNLANPGTYDAAPGSAPTFDAATGWTFNGSSNYLTCGIVPGNAYSYIMCLSDGTASGLRAIFGSDGTGARMTIFVYNFGDTCQYNHNGAKTQSPAFLSGVFALCGRTAYRNGTGESAFGADFSQAATNAIYIGAWNNGSGAAQFFAGKVQAFAVYDTTLDAAQVAAVSAAMAAL